MKRFRKNLCLIVALLMLTLAGCKPVNKINTCDHSQDTVIAETNQYTVLYENGVYSICFHQNASSSQWGEDEHGYQTVEVTPTFTTIHEMVDAILKGDFSPAEMETIMRCFPQDEAGHICLFDLNALSEPSIPEDLTLRSIFWSGDKYSFLFLKGEMQVWISCCTEEKYKQILEEHTSYYDNERITVHSQEQVADRDAVIYHYSTNTNKGKNIHYTYQTENKTITIREEYSSLESMKIPSGVSFVGEQNGFYFYGSIYGLDQRPDYEWLQAFGLHKYSPNTE